MYGDVVDAGPAGIYEYTSDVSLNKYLGSIANSSETILCVTGQKLIAHVVSVSSGFENYDMQSGNIVLATNNPVLPIGQENFLSRAALHRLRKSENSSQAKGIRSGRRHLRLDARSLYR